MKFSEWVNTRPDDLLKAGEGYEQLSALSKKCIDYAVEEYIKYLRTKEVNNDLE